MNKTTSRDGTAIAFEQTGQGPAVILVVGAFNDCRRSSKSAEIWTGRPGFTTARQPACGHGRSGYCFFLAAVALLRRPAVCLASRSL